MNAEELLPGSRLIVRRRAYFHHGIYVGNGRMIHYAGWFRGMRGLVEEVTLEQFTEGHGYCIGRMPPDRRAGEDIVRRARSRLGERRYHLLRNNCEHFCNWCQLGECRSAAGKTTFRSISRKASGTNSWSMCRLIGFTPGTIPKLAQGTKHSNRMRSSAPICGLATMSRHCFNARLCLRRVRRRYLWVTREPMVVPRAVPESRLET